MVQDSSEMDNFAKCAQSFYIVPIAFKRVQLNLGEMSANGRLFGEKLPLCLRHKAYLGPRSSAEHSLRFRESALAGSDEFSPTPLILNAYQRLKNEHRQKI